MRCMKSIFLEMHDTGIIGTIHDIKAEYHGGVGISSNEFRATLGKDIFENVIYKDNRGNKVTYSKEFLGKLRKGRHRGDRNIEEFLLLGLAKDVGKKRNYTEEYTVEYSEMLNIRIARDVGFR